MSSRIIIDGNAIYEVDEECLRKKKEKEQEEEHEKQQEKRKKIKHKKGGDIICPASGLSERIRSEFRN